MPQAIHEHQNSTVDEAARRASLRLEFGLRLQEALDDLDTLRMVRHPLVELRRARTQRGEIPSYAVSKALTAIDESIRTLEGLRVRLEAALA